MRALLVGLGSIGRRHLSNLRQIEPGASITVWHQHTRADVVPGADRVVYSLEAALAEKPEVALIAGPAVTHIETGLALAREGIHLFIEKPLAHDAQQVEALIALCHQSNLIMMVGYNLRFSAPLRVMQQAASDGRIGRLLGLRAEVGQYLPDWRKDTDYRQGVSARRELGGGAILELSHELDYARWLMGEVKTVSAQADRVGDLDIDVEDLAEITLRFQSGAIGQVHVDMLQRAATRVCRLIGTEGTLTWDAIGNQVRLFEAATQTWSDLHPATSIDRNAMYVAELKHFLECVAQRTPPLIGGEDGWRVLQIALAAKQSAREQRVIEL
ncbi:MAG: Gfo/Idh/MocA family oxidoreductase [Thermoflexales bacterium]|nr:Gfo/Idh/MocA family oxidoreductase [Thermoflexales bacterium]